MRTIYKKELKTYFYTGSGWLFLAVFTALASLIFYLNNILPRSSEFAPFLSMMSYVWMLLTPLLVMRLMAGERRGNTENLLMSAPLGVTSLVMGKYLAACTVLFLAVVLSLAYPLLVLVHARLYLGETLTGYLGYFLQGCAFIALDLLVTCNLRNTTSAAALAFGVNLFMWLLSLMTNSPIIPAFLAGLLNFISLYGRYVPFLSGQFSPANTLFYLLFILCALSLAVLFVKVNRGRRT